VNAIVCHTAEFSPVLLYSNRRLAYKNNSRSNNTGYKTTAAATQLLYSNRRLGYKNNSSSNNKAPIQQQRTRIQIQQHQQNISYTATEG
jgi:hypothetical protein